MKVLIAGDDRTSALAGRLLPDLSRKGARAPAFPPPQDSALALGTARNTAEYLDRLMRLAWIHRGISASYFDVPRQPGLLRGLHARVRSLLWRLLRYQHERTIFQQNTLSELIVGALACEREQHQCEIEQLNRRIEALEQRQPGGQA